MKKIYARIFFVLVLFCLKQLSAQTGLKINEIDYDAPGLDSAEFIELYNSSANAIDLGNYRLLLINGNNNTIYDSISLPATLLNPGAFFVICGSLNIVPLCNMVLPATSNIIQNGSPDAIALVENVTGNVVDAVSYEGDVAPPYIEGTGIPIANSDAGFTHFQGNSRFPDGQDSNNNTADFVLACITPGLPNVSDTINCMQPTAITKVVSKKSLLVYPNPSRGISIVDFNGKQFNHATLSVHNLLGKEVKLIKLNSNQGFQSLDLSEFSDGVYYIKISSDAGDFTQKVILRK